MNIKINVALHWFLLPLLFVAFSLSALGQANSVISGTVTDKGGAVVPGAQATLLQTSTGYKSSAESNGSGNFTFPALNVGSYDLTVTSKGFQTVIQRGIAVNVSQTVHTDVSLTVGNVSDTVTVTADQLAVQTDSNVVSTLISADQISQLATENRNFAALVSLGLGVSSMLPDSNTPTSVGSSSSISVNGLRQSHNIWLIDGGEADDRGGGGGINIMPSQDAIAQVETLASNYPPDYGISSGATISLALKSGTRNFHGTLFEFNRNTVFNANSVLNKQSNPATKRSKLNYNIFGFNIGGPLFIPGLYNTNRQKTFFFWNEEWRKLIQGSTPSKSNTLPTADFPVAGQALTYVSPAFASAPIVPTVPNNSDPAYNARLLANGLTPGQPFPGNKIPANLFDPNALAYLATGIVPKSNASGDQFIGQASLPINVRDDVVRIDHRFNDKLQILVHYLHDSVTQANPAPMLGWSTGTYPTITSTLSNPSNSAAVKLTAEITPSLLAEASINYDGNIIDIVNSPLGNLPAGFTAGKFFANGSKSVPGMQWNGAYGVQENPGSAPWHNAAQDLSPKLDVSYTQGKHQMKFGISYNRYTKNQKLFLNTEGNYQFGTQSGDPFLDMILGLSSSYSQSQQAPIRHYVNQTPSAYAMDTWRVTPRLSLQLGLRYDALPHAWERQNQVANFNPNAYLSSQAPTWKNDGTLDPNGPGFQNVNGSPFYLNGVTSAGVNKTPVGLVSNDYKTLQPRIGFSEDLLGNGKTVLRGGIGTFFERLQGNDIYNAATAAPFANTPQASSVYLSNPTQSWVTGLSASTPFFAQGSTTLAQTYRAPAVAQFSLGVQHQLASSVILIVQYVGNVAWHQNINRAINTYSLNTPLITANKDPSLGNNFDRYTRANAGDPNNKSGTNPNGNSIPTPNQLRVYNGFGGITQQENTTNGNYNSFQTAVRAQNRWGLSGELDYTYSHEIDITSGDLSNVDNPFNIKYNKGSGTFDRRQILSANYIYSLPFFTHPGFAHTALGGWQIAGTAIFQTGTPVTPRFSAPYDPVGLGGGYTNRPNVVGKVKNIGKQNQWFDISGFSIPTPAWAGGANQGFGNAGKDAIRGPGRVNFTTSLYKSFAITEGSHFELRVESFNTFNTAQFNGVNNTYGNKNFGQVNSYYDPRSLELGGKFVF